MISAMVSRAHILFLISFFFENRDYYELIERLQINREKLRIPEELMERMKTASSASLAPSSHYTQPWTVRILEPKRWVIGSDKKRWLTYGPCIQLFGKPLL